MSKIGTYLRASFFRAAIGVLIAASAWWVFVTFLSVMYRFPTPDQVVGASVSMWREGTLTHDTSVSMARWFVGWSFGAFVGVGLGILTGRSRLIGFLVEPPITLFKAAPFITLIPLSLRIFGLSEIGKFLLIGWIAFTVSWVVMHEAVQQMPLHLRWLWKSTEASWCKWVTHVLIPFNWPHISASMRASAALSLIVVAAVEMGGAYERSSGFWWSEGLGYRVFRALDIGRDDMMLAGITVFAICGLVIDRLVVVAPRLVADFARKTSRSNSAILVENLLTEQDSDTEDKTCPEIEIVLRNASYKDARVISSLTLSLDHCKTIGIVAPSGAGKTTLLRCVAGLEFPDFSFEVERTSNQNPLSTDAVSSVFQESSVFEHLTVWQNASFGVRNRSKSSNLECLNLIREFGLAGKESRRAGDLSGGERQRLALAMALSNHPTLLLLDEPFGALDVITRREMQRFFFEKIRGNVASIFITHSIDEAVLLSDKILVGVRDGVLIDVDRKESDFEAFEKSAVFSRTRIRILDALYLGTNKDEQEIPESSELAK